MVMGPFFIFCLVTLLLLSPLSYTEASDLKPAVQIEQAYRYDIQQEPETEDLYLGRLALIFPLTPKLEWRVNDLAVFFEARHNFNTDRLSRQELGLELSHSLHRWFQWRESLQQVFLSPGKNVLEIESRLLFDFPLPPNQWNVHLYALEEHTYAITLGEITLNEITGGLRLPIKNLAAFWLGWRHVDRVHQFDSDLLEAGMDLTF